MRMSTRRCRSVRHAVLCSNCMVLPQAGVCPTIDSNLSYSPMFGSAAHQVTDRCLCRQGR